jgi:hypothetical protein
MLLKHAADGIRRRRAADAAAQRDCVVLEGEGIGAVATTSEIASRPPGFSTRNASRNVAALSGLRLTTQLERMTSMLPSSSCR